MALTAEQIKIIIAAELDKRGFDQANKATKGLTHNFKQLGYTIGVALSARAFINFAKVSAQAFAKEEKAVKQLTNSLANLGFAYSVPAVERFLESQEQATLVTKDELRPAIVSLITTTMDARKSMDLLALSLDIAAGTGADVSQVTSALTRAYNGNYTALAKLSKGYTAAELDANGFDATISLLSKQFSGSAAAASDTYAFKIEQLELAANKAREEIGKGLLDAIATLGSGNYNEGLQDLVDFGNDIGKAFGYAAGAVNTLKGAYDIITLGAVQRKTMELLGKSAQDQARGGTTTPTQLELAKAAIQERKEQAIRDKIRKDRERLARLEEAERRKRQKALREEQQLKRAGTVFDMDNIQIVAALQGKVTDDQRLRLTALLALNNKNAEAAENLSLAILASNAAALETVGVTMKAGDTVDDVITKIINAQTKLSLVKSGIADIPKAKNPFEDWPDIIAKILAGISNIKNAVGGIGGGNNGGGAGDGGGGGGGGGRPGGAPGSGNNFLIPDDGGGNFEPIPLPPSGDLFIGDPNSTIGRGGDVGIASIVINVGGSVVTENDLVTTITNAIYNRQKSGQSINYGTSI